MEAQISRIDREINANQRRLRQLEKINPHSPQSWQAAWDRQPALWAREQELFRSRGAAQRERDERAANIRLPRPKSPKKCPTCGHRTLAA